MALKLQISKRDLKYSSGKFTGDTLESLVKNLNSLEVDNIIVSGESKSYTFLRQVTLLLNLLIKTKGAKINLQSKSFGVRKGLFFPIYE